MGRIGSQIKRLWERESCVQFFAPHRRVVKALQVDDEQLGEAVDGQVLLNVDLFLAGGAFEARGNHALWLDKFVQAFAQLDAAQEPHSLPRNLHTQVHEVVKGAVLEAAAEAAGPTAELTLEEVSHGGVVPGLVILVVLFALLNQRHVRKI